MEQVIELGSFWLIKGSGCIATVKSIVAKANGGATVVYTITDNSGVSSYRMSCEYELFTNIVEKLIAKSELKEELNTEYVKGKTDGYNEGYQHGFTLAKEKITELDEEERVNIYNEGYNDGKCFGINLGKNDTLFQKQWVESEKDKSYKDGYKHGHNHCSEEFHSHISEKELEAKEELESEYQRGLKEGKYLERLDSLNSRQHHYHLGYDDALAHMASEEVEDTLELKKQGYEEGYGGGFEDGFNTAIREMSNNQTLGETSEYKFGTEDCCEHHNPNKETQEAMQEVLDKDSNGFEGIWVAKDGSGKLKVLSIDEGDCDVELIEHVSNSFLCIGDAATISVDDLKEHWNKEGVENKKVKHNHYRKSVEHLDYIDIYRVCKLFKVKDDSHCLHHSIKKLLMSGQRGAGKSKIQDITEARDSLNSYLENEELFKGCLDD